MVRPFGAVTKQDVENEIRALSTLLKDGGHPNIVSFLNHGCLSDQRYFIDMELCDLNLDDYIRGKNLDFIGMKESASDSFFNSAVSARDKSLTKWVNVWAIMNQIATGLEFIHSKGQVHRDLKPRNSTFHSCFKC